MCMFTSNLVQKMRRDTTEFLAKGVDAPEVDALETKGNDFEVLPDDLYYSTQVTESRHTKTTQRRNDKKRAVLSGAARFERKARVYILFFIGA